MRHPVIVTLSICGFLLASCGRVESRKVAMPVMSEDQALNQLMDVPLELGGRNAFGKQPKSNLSASELTAILQDLAAQGKLGNGRMAVGGKLDLSTLTQIFSLLNSGKANSISSILQGLLSLNGGSTGATGSKLDSIMAIINMALPIIMSIAPQFAPILAALTTILPLVINLIGMFKKPKPSADAAAFLRFATLS